MTLTPHGQPGGRTWDTASPYARQHLAGHAAACGELDGLVGDPGFLLASDPGAVLAQRTNLRTPQGKRALAAFDLSLGDWDKATPTIRLDRLAANAARVHATTLVMGCAFTMDGWPVHWAAWNGQGHRSLQDHGLVSAVAIGHAGGRDIIVSFSVSRSDRYTVQVWDAVTGEPVGAPLGYRDSPVSALAVGRVGDRDIIVLGSGYGR